MDGFREAHASGLCHSLQASRDVHALSEEVATANGYIAQVDADPEMKTPILRCIGRDLPKPLLHRNRALNGIYSARKFREHAVASRVGDSPAMLRNKSVHNFARGSEGAQRTGLVLTHQTRVSSYVGGEDRRETPFGPLLLFGLHPSALVPWPQFLKCKVHGCKGWIVAEPPRN